MICKICRGSGSLLRSRPDMPIKMSFKKCGHCGGAGIRGKKIAGMAPAIIQMHALKNGKAKTQGARRR